MARSKPNGVKAHSDASPSSSSIWLECPASVTKARGRQRVATVYTTEGTAAHALAEIHLRGHTTLPVDGILIDGQKIPVTEEMKEAVDTYVAYVASRPAWTKRIETRVQVTLDGEVISGTVDAHWVEDGEAEVIDFKYGQGHRVWPDSPQLRLYGIGVINEHPFEDINSVKLTIVQPRTDPDNPINSITLTAKELLDWERDKLRPAVALIEAGDTTETPGSHCKWCVRAGECHALASLAQSNAKVAFGDTPPDPGGMANDELGALLDHAQMIVDWVNKVRAEASQRLDKGEYVPGWKLVARRAQRRWDKPVEAIVELTKQGIFSMDIMRIETIGVVEKAMKRAKVPLSVLDPFTIKESSGTTLVSEKDGREAIDNSAQAVFGSVVDL